MKILRLILLPMVLACSPWTFAIDRKAAVEALERLDATLEQRASYIDRRQNQIDSLCGLLSSDPESAGVLMEIADAYTGFNNDSALVYLNRGLECTSGVDRLPFMWKHASLLPLSGFFEAATKEFSSINPDSVPPEMLASYYDAGRQMHSYIAAFFQTYPGVRVPNEVRALELQEKLLDVLPLDSREYKFNFAEYNFLTGKLSMALVLLDEVVDSEAPDSKLRARAAHHLSRIARERGHEDAHLFYLATSALADALSATREVASLQELGVALNAEGDVARAHRYLSGALANAVECGAPLRMVDTSQSLPIIERAHSRNNARWQRTMKWILAGMVVLLCMMLGLVLLLRRDMVKMRALQAGLVAANNAKEVYISQFLQLCSIYMDKLNQFCKIASRKLAAGQSDELYRMVKSGKFVEEQSREFYEVFDNAFLHIYPDFVAQVNRLLRPDSQIELKDGELLNTDLRILAFLRLGIEESARIAQVLNYSLNTIYSYRNRLKMRALDKDDFERQIMEIRSI